MLLDGEDVVSTVTKSGTPSMKYVLGFLFFPLVMPFLVFQVITAMRKRLGLKSRPLEGKVVVITGASSGIGESLAKLLYSSGCKLILASRRVDELDRVKAELLRTKTFGTVYVPAIVQLDLNDMETISAKSSEILKIYGFVDILINNAGISHRGTVKDTSIDVDQQIMRVNYFGPLALTKNIVNAMVERQQGRVVFMSSVQGKIAIPYRSAYTASKHAIQALADSMRAELKDSGIEVTIVSPGYVKTQISMNALTATGDNHGEMDASTAAGDSPDYIAKRTVSAIKNGDKDVVICAFLSRVAIYIRTLSPSLYFWIMAKRARKEK